MKMKRAFCLLLTLAMMLTLLAGCGSTAQAAETTEEKTAEPAAETKAADAAEETADTTGSTENMWETYTDYAESYAGTAKDIVFLRGTWYDMGCQYVKQAPNAVTYQITSFIGSAKSEYGSFSDAWDALQTRYKYYEEYGPELLDFYKGISDTSGFSYEETIVAYLYSGGSLCNAETAWGDATGGTAYCAFNSDMTLANEYLAPIMMMYPEDPAYPQDKYPFAYYNGRGFNCLGLVAGGTGGQGNVEGDDGDSGFATHREDMIIPARCATAEEAKDMYLSGYWMEGGYNFVTIDNTGKSYVIEHTKTERAIREPNKSIEGDRDYFIVTNGYVEEEMQEHLYTDGSFDDCPIRYETIKYFMERDYGKINLDTFIDAQSCITYIDPETGKMTEEPVWGNDMTSYFSPSNVAPNEKTTDRVLIDSTNAVLYSLSGNQNTLISALPNATGTFFRMSLSGEPMEIVEEMKTYAQLYLYQAEKEIYQAEDTEEARLEKVNAAKWHIMKGDRYLGMAKYSESTEDVLAFCAQAASEFAEAQCYAKAAWNDPFTAYSDYDGQFAF